MSSQIHLVGSHKPIETRDWLQALFDASPMAIGFSRDGVMLDANPAYLRLFRYGSAAELYGKLVLEQIAPSHRGQVQESISARARGGHPPERYETRGQKNDGVEFPMEVVTTRLVLADGPVAIAFISDVSEREQHEAEQRALTVRVQQAQKLESLGVLAGGVAHDFNNILTVILNEVALAQRACLEGGAQAAVHLDAVSLAAERAADLCRQMLAYAGKARLEREPVELTALVGEMSSMLEASISKKVRLVRELEAGLPSLRGDATQIRQVVMNLVINASEAIVGPQGTIRVSTGVGICDGAALSGPVTGGVPKDGRYVWLEVRDDGAGMDAATVAQMFDPFFTTKLMGRGLGMAAVLGIVRGHGGAIDVESSPGAGSRIRVLFPATSAEVTVAIPKAEEGLRGEGVVLVVDDEKNVRLSTERLLKGFGFEVLVACDGVEALELLRSAPKGIDVVLLDLSMPRMDGTETLKKLRELDPTVPVVLSSGYGSISLAEEPDATLPKPYVPERLFATLLKVMRRRHSSSSEPRP
jgi:PAS domain S-box-containing protein